MKSPRDPLDALEDIPENLTLRQRIPEVEPRVRSLLEAMKAEPPESRT